MTTPNCSKMPLDGTIDLPPMLEAVACGRLLGKQDNTAWGILEPDTLQPKVFDGLLVGRTLTDIMLKGFQSA